MTTPHPLTTLVQGLLQRIRAFDERRPRAWDLTLTSFWVIAALTDYASSGWRRTAQNTDVPGWLLICMSLGFTVPLLWRRSRPLTVLLVIAPFSLLNGWTGAILQASLVQGVVIFHVALHRPIRELAWAASMTLAPLVVGTVRYPQGAWDWQLGPGIWTFTLTALLGIAVRSRKEYTDSLVDRARRLEVERDQQAQLAAAAERARIAREMHDIIGHNLSVITTLADGGAYAARKSPDRGVQALEAIGTTSRQALSELRRLLGVLREGEGTSDSPTRAPQPGLADLASLVESVRSTGLQVSLTVKGTAPAQSAGRQLTVYRVVQEALTNTLKHGGEAASATVDATYAPDGITVTVTDTGAGRCGNGGWDGAEGRGITGMRERTALYDGTLEAAPLPGGGWRVHLRLPPESTALDTRRENGNPGT
nr:histidine kinase [Streptomyces poonensis]